MKAVAAVLAAALAIVVTGCAEEHAGADPLSVEFTWEGLTRCEWGNPEIRVAGVPEHTVYLLISMYDHAYSHDHGRVKIAYTGNGIFPKDSFKEIQGPCPICGRPDGTKSPSWPSTVRSGSSPSARQAGEALSRMSSR